MELQSLDACHYRLSYYTSENERYAVGGCQHSDMATFSFHLVKASQQVKVEQS